MPGQCSENYYDARYTDARYRLEILLRMIGAGVRALPYMSYRYLIIRDRSKDLIKSGGEWISSVDLENAISALPNIGPPPQISDLSWVPLAYTRGIQAEHTYLINPCKLEVQQ